MTSEGFNIDINFDKSSGLIFGGNKVTRNLNFTKNYQNNCGTWMDKMGESEIANNKGNSLQRVSNVISQENHLLLETVQQLKSLGF